MIKITIIYYSIVIQILIWIHFNLQFFPFCDFRLNFINHKSTHIYAMKIDVNELHSTIKLDD